MQWWFKPSLVLQAQRGEIDSDEAEGSGSEKEEEEEESETESSSSEEEEDSKEKKAKGVSGIIECENPNRAGAKATKKVSELTAEAGKPQLSRREREELEKQRAAASYRKLHAQGKTEEARADLERLALIRAKRAEAEQKRKEQQEGIISKSIYLYTYKLWSPWLIEAVRTNPGYGMATLINL